MRNKKIFNNLFDSIIVTVLFLVSVLIYLILLRFCVFGNNGNNLISFFICTGFCGVLMALCAVLFVRGRCFEYWILSDNSIVSKKPFSKKQVVMLSEIEKVEKKIVPALVLEVFRSEAYVIYFKTERIVILIKEKKDYSELDKELAKLISE